MPYAHGPSRLLQAHRGENLAKAMLEPRLFDLQMDVETPRLQRGAAPEWQAVGDADGELREGKGFLGLRRPTQENLRALADDALPQVRGQRWEAFTQRVNHVDYRRERARC